MGLFSSTRYTKEGPGVYADDPKRGPFFRFFQTYGNKFFKIVSTNFLLVIFNDFGQTKEKTDIEKDESTFPRKKTGIG